VGTHDGVPSNPPQGVLAGSPPINDFAGNWVSIRIAPRRYLLYAHMVPGSVRVRTGQQVRPGQVIGLLGNSGNSSTPHLHFQVSDRPGFAPVDSVPYVFDRFAFVGPITDEFSDETLALQPTGDLAFARPAHRACAGRRGRWTATCSGSVKPPGAGALPR
jgi:murein DD-endopeptidase MepM/ murein hydrolase activator NlpD